MISKSWNLDVKDAIQCFIFKPTTMKYFSINKKGFLGVFCHLLNKPRFYESVDVSKKIMKEGETLGYWVPIDLSRCRYFCLCL